MTMFKLGWKGKTRGGLDARVVVTDAVGHAPLVVLYKEGDTENARNIRADGRWWGPDHEHSLDLMPRTKEVTRWMPAHPHWGYETEEKCRVARPDADQVSYTFTIPDDGGSEE